jgi:hypothetical protein
MAMPRLRRGPALPSGEHSQHLTSRNEKWSASHADHPKVMLKGRLKPSDDPAQIANCAFMPVALNEVAGM